MEQILLEKHDQCKSFAPIPKRRLTLENVVLMVGAPVVAYLGGLGSAMGKGEGLVLSGFATLVMVTFYSLRLGRRNEPRVPPYMRYLAIGVAVSTFVLSYGLFKSAPHPDAVTYLAPLLPIALFAGFIALLFARRR